MRPSFLNPLFAPLSTFRGVGKKYSLFLSKIINCGNANETRFIDLLFYHPSSFIDRHYRPKISEISEERIVTITGYISQHSSFQLQKRRPYKILLNDGTGEITLLFFYRKTEMLKNVFFEGRKITVTGKIKKLKNRIIMVHPHYIFHNSQDVNFPLIEAVYSLPTGLSVDLFKKIIVEALSRLPVLPEWIEKDLLQKKSFPSIAEAFNIIHNPRKAKDFEWTSPARERLAYDELLAGQIALLLMRKQFKKEIGIPINVEGKIAQKILRNIPFSPTKSQESAIKDILQDMSQKNRMLRILQGDVGSGKTLVALIAMAAAVEAGGQAVIMAPIGILAQQHYEFIKKYTQNTQIIVEIITGNMPQAHRRKALERIAHGQAHIIIGTHALFQDSIQYYKLILVIVDEQHRFGVQQRLKLTQKATAPHVLLMTATPIPRTLVLTSLGDIDISKITEKPAGRKPIKTVIIPINRIDEVIERLKVVLSEGKKAYWICPQIEEKKESNFRSVVERFNSLHEHFTSSIAIIHGRMSDIDKESVMDSFKNGTCKLLIATTVIEVGIDVVDASIIIIENAEHFGLAQLHQLRGRVGRGEEISSCILLYHPPLSKNSYTRLSVLKNTEDGFLIAEEDLKQRKEGEILGIKQSGMPKFLIAQPELHDSLLEIARKDAKHILTQDPDLTSVRGQSIRILLYLYQYNEAFQFIRAG
ncbi:ATP-dependent DNA helicase RecG [Candidatus Liberibacter asiaticus]|uniref:Probable DNA 3'-5' helicase RecG n=3 Tax=Liberibacter asiaticus TaxID=34021 RepID=C6XGB5_LIBAP|nr:ATP-dependent DNA helicase RecG [Candidatus Liberibacter asiaticus]ACT57418.1 ATP-dependent DNA helicase RecG [Candidatus Liberibacter asiaticus str. psy62]AGH17181.1 ATP-dependent DNA helicase RecG [Candidatus Liberibacter asiaticus str. gxpsy]ALK07486.1 ATP-dependent DNA helicase RecG [Candidatus Liberibacter asiaticus]ASK52976.1 ATP-dependent DNA helicase RecG [Candidatus Liberibacter asiaticus]AWL14302.1 ATP-dependent DNA helicase RecG [Candidatus Liberibacter asiaticus]